MISRFIATPSIVLFAALHVSLTGCSGPSGIENDRPESNETARKGMVAAAHPLAVESGLEVLDRGGGAFDAAVAVEATLGLVEPQSSGFAGSAFLHYDAASNTVTAYNGRERAPISATPDHFFDKAGDPTRRSEVMLGGISIGVPGVVAMLHLVHGEHGKLTGADSRRRGAARLQGSTAP